MVQGVPNSGMGHQPDPASSPRSQPQPQSSELPLRLPQPSLPVWAVFLFVFSRLLSPKLLSFLIQRVSSFFSERAQRTILGTVANCSSHPIPHSHKIFVGTLMISERTWGCRRKRPYLEKTENYYQRTKYHNVNEEKRRKMVLRHWLKKGTVIKVSRVGILSSQNSGNILKGKYRLQD